MNPFIKAKVVADLDKQAEELYGEFGYMTLELDDKFKILNNQFKSLHNEKETLLDHDRLLQAIQVEKEIKIVLAMLDELQEF